MKQILVSGLINIETTLQVDGFPIHYTPVEYPFHGVNSTVSGVGYNIAKALTTLGHSITFLSLIGRDQAGQMIRIALKTDNISGDFILETGSQTAQSVILFDPSGHRQIHVDVKDLQAQQYPVALFDSAMENCSIAVLCNINFSRSLLARAKELGQLIATDVHAISDPNDEYNRDFLAAADILFMSDEHLPLTPERFGKRIMDQYGPQILVIGLGEKGALLGVREDRSFRRFPAVITRRVVNTIGAGDALLSGFIHSYLEMGDPYQAIQKAILFASYKIGSASASDGFLNQKKLGDLFREVS